MSYLDFLQRGKVELDFSSAVLDRGSAAWNPYTGEPTRNDVPRMAPHGALFDCVVRPRVWATHAAGLTLMTYDQLLARQATFEFEYPEFTRVVLGTSFQGREIIAYRLGPMTRKHWVVILSVHGNENDGAEGTFTALQILARSSVFAAFRQEWTIFVVPALNPDGWALGTRNLAQIGPNGRTVNLNRNWDWFWAEYNETAFESKGAAAESSMEAQALLTYYRTEGVTFGFLLDQHANQGVGSRYMSRDRIWRGVSAPGTEGSFPTNYRSLWADWLFWRYTGQLGTLRAATGGPDLFIRYLRSRFRPHLHSYFSSQGIVSIAMEEVKVDAAEGRETISTACDFRTDATIAAAIVATESFWAPRYSGGVLLERPATQAFSNASLEQWQNDEYRPGNFTPSRLSMTRDPEGEGGQRDNGRSLTAQAETDVRLPAAAEFNAGALALFDTAIVLTGAGAVMAVPVSDGLPLVWIASVATHVTPSGAAMFPRPGLVAAIAFGGGAMALDASPSALYTELSASGEATIAPSGSVPPGTQHAGYCDDTLRSLGLSRGFLAGGWRGGGVVTAALYHVNLTTNAWSLSAAVLTQPLYGVCSVYDPDRERVWMFGGVDALGVKRANSGYWDLAPDTFTNLTGSVPFPLPAAFITGVFSTFDRKIYLYGGEDASNEMLTTIYRFDPATAVFELLVITVDLDDDEDVEHTLGDTEASDVSDEGAWQIALGRTLAVMAIEAIDDERGSVMLFGGRFDTAVGALSDESYLHRPDLNIIGLTRSSEYGYFRYSTSVLSGTTNIVTEPPPTDGDAIPIFGDSPDWSDPLEVWTLGEDARSSGTYGPFIYSVAPPRIAHDVSCVVSRAAAGTSTHFDIVVRGQFTDEVLDDGYRLRAFDGTGSWELQRVVGGVATTLLGAAASFILGTVARTVRVQVSGTDPVRIVVTVDGNSLFDVEDTSSARIREDGATAFGGQSGTTDVVVSQFVLNDIGFGIEDYTLSVLARADTANTSGYLRIALQPKDADNYVTRRVRTYYIIPPSSWWMQQWVRIASAHAPLGFHEDGVRAYVRAYKHQQPLRIDAPMLSLGSRLPTTWMPTGQARAAESMQWAAMVPLNRAWVEFTWLPHGGFVNLTADLEIARFSVDASNYLRIVARAGDEYEREYNLTSMHGPHDPTIRLEKVLGAAVVATVDLVVYWGYAQREPGNERVDEPMRFTVMHIAGDRLAFRIRRFGYEVERESKDDVDVFADAPGNITFSGHGVFSAPCVRTHGVQRNGQTVPLGRAGLDKRLRQRQSDGVFALGERDPTNGQIVTSRPFRTDTFNRVNSTNLGTDWTVVKQSGAGFNIIANKADCVQAGFEVWLAPIRHQSYIVSGRISISDNNCIVGLLARLDRVRMTETGQPFGYGFELLQVASDSASLRIVTWWNGVREIIDAATLSSYSAGEELTMTVTLDGDTLEVEIDGRGSVSVTDTLFRRPGRAGMMGETGSSAQHVTIDDFTVAPNFSSSVA